uniref:X8 domain-containing protein n=1 Tax=Oryza meridionalis TaxID=40149 RepID=A0A0E0E2N1_9ORYZ
MPAASSPLPLLLLLLLAVAGAGAAGAGAGAGVGVSGGGQLWCVAKNNADDAALQAAVDWACGPAGGADCRAIQQGGACYDPPDLLAHASYAFNDYFLRAGGAPAAPAACDFSGAAALTALNPSHGSCVFPSSTSPKNGSFTGTTTYGPAGADLSKSSSRQLNFCTDTGEVYLIHTYGVLTW